MVYKIRNKSFFWTKSGWKNNYHGKVTIAERPSNPDTTMSIVCRYDHMSFLRMFQSYRNISRHCKQYFYGNKELEESFILGLRSFFHIPFKCETPVELIKQGGVNFFVIQERRMADQIDRDFELVSHNTHPFQLFTYEVNNRKIAKQQEQYETQQRGEQTFEEKILNYIDQVFKDEQKKHGSDYLTLEKKTEIILHVMRKVRAELQRPSQNSTNPDGNINDFLEIRRPFTEPNPNTVSS